MTGNGRPYALATWAPRTLGPAFSSWPPARDPSGTWRLLPNPQARDHRGAQLPELRRAAGHQVNLNDAAIGLARNWKHDGWGWYEQVIRRWEAITGRAAPFPTERSRRGTPRLSAVFAEWLMEVPGWVTGVPSLPYCAQIRALGSGVVSRQAAAALRLLIRAAGRGPADLTDPRQVNVDAGGPGRKASRACTPAAPCPPGKPAPTAAARAPRPRTEGEPRVAPATAKADAPRNHWRAA